MDYSRSLSKQKQVLAMRNQWVAHAGSAQDKLRAEDTAFSIMQDACSERLAPVLIQRNNAELIAAYLMQKIGDNSWRFLITGANWRICRAKSSARLIKVPAALLAQFSAVAGLQGALIAGIEELKNLCLKEGKKNARTQIHTGQGGFSAKKQQRVCQGRAAGIKDRS